MALIIGIILCGVIAIGLVLVSPLTRSWFKEGFCEPLRKGNLITQSDMPLLDELELLEKSPLWTPADVAQILTMMRSERFKAVNPADKSGTEDDRLSQFVMWKTFINVIDARLRPPRPSIDEQALADITNALVDGLADPNLQTRQDFALILIDCRLIMEPRVRKAVEALLNDPNKPLASNIRRQLAWYDMGRASKTSSGQ